MVNNGINNLCHVNVQLVMNGLACSAKKLTTVLQIEYGMRQYKHVYAHQIKYGMEDNAQFSHSVVEEGSGMSKISSVSVYLDGNGIHLIVFYAKLGRCGINHPSDVSVPEVQSLMILLFNVGL